MKSFRRCSTSTSQPSTSLIELLTAERDAKRRRATYRKKGVSTNKKSYNEVSNFFWCFLWNSIPPPRFFEREADWGFAIDTRIRHFSEIKEGSKIF